MNPNSKLSIHIFKFSNLFAFLFNKSSQLVGVLFRLVGILSWHTFQVMIFFLELNYFNLKCRILTSQPFDFSFILKIAFLGFYFKIMKLQRKFFEQLFFLLHGYSWFSYLQLFFQTLLLSNKLVNIFLRVDTNTTGTTHLLHFLFGRLVLLQNFKVLIKQFLNKFERIGVHGLSKA